MRIKNFTETLSISAMLNIAILGVLATLFSITTFLLSRYLSEALIKEQIISVSQSAQQAVSEIGALENVLNLQITRLGRMFAAKLPHEFSLGAKKEIDGVLTRQIWNGGKPLNHDYEIVDTYTMETGAFATIFALDDKKFLRVTTSIKREDGSRAINTYLDDDHPAKQELLAGKNYIGVAQLFNKDYITIYLPIMNANKETIGALFVGLALEEFYETIGKDLMSIKFGETGYMFVVSAADRNKGTFLYHPKHKGENWWGKTFADGELVIQKIIEQKEGEISYLYQDAGEKPKEKYSAFRYYPDWQWIVVSVIDAKEATKTARQVSNILIAGVLVLLLILAVTTTMLLGRYLKKPMKVTGGLLSLIAEGNFKVEVPPHNENEIGKLLKSMELMIAKLREALTDINNYSNDLLKKSGEMLKSSEVGGDAARKQSDESGAIALSVKQMLGTLGEIANASRQDSKTAEESDHIASRGEKVIGAASAAMKNIADAVRSASSSIFQLGKESKEVNSIVDTIGEIADQTNLLALNAAIEAARAGEHGRGFAVVADEVRKLAEKTQESASEISALIKKILEGTDNAVQRMNESVSLVEKGASFAEDAKSRMTEISNGSVKVSQAIAFVSKALNE
ncbi:MAG: methyl-accepting chemotaxis protein, partial [Helicobacteraceae bacterium]|nr:methyl-accepting chemotaxis protein [Helicobacteraceae bacterium]